MPQTDAVKITHEPFAYYNLNAELDLSLFGFNFRFKDNWNNSNLKESFIKREETALIEKQYKTREKIFNLLGYITPFQYKRKFNLDLYADSYFRIFQTGLTIDKSITYTDKTMSKNLPIGEKYMINIFQESYALGFIYSKKIDYNSYYSYYFFAAIGLRYTEVVAPHYLIKEETLESITSKRYSLFILSETRHKKIAWRMEANHGIAHFMKPNGDIIDFYGLKICSFLES